jgi:hypothetical protein
MGEGRGYGFPAAAAIKSRHSRSRGVTPVARRPAHAKERARDSGQAMTTGRAAVADPRIDMGGFQLAFYGWMRAAVALLALCALLLGAAPSAPAEDDAETAPGAAKGTAGGPAPRSGGSPNGPAVNSAPGDDSELEREDALSPPNADPDALDPDETAPLGDEGSVEDELSVLPVPEGRGARALDDPYAADPYDADPYDSDED